MQRLSFLLWFLVSFSTLCASEFQFYPGAVYAPEIPTLKQVTGHDWGEKITSYSEMRAYIRALSKASPKIKVVDIGETWEGRTLQYMVVASENNMQRLQEIKSGIQKLADPRGLSTAEAGELINKMPSIVWLAYAVHGNEISSTDAALLLAYHLVAVQGDSVATAVLANTVVIIDPLQNPDGRDRFVHYFRQTRGRWPDADQQASEHNEAWPGGRTNHYLFDMNRDWFALTQPETQARVKAFLEWFPQVYVDLHEMGSNETYYFPPPAAPLNPEFTKAQVRWLGTFGENNARWFDKFQFDYFTREVFDSFYPGYGEGWPMLHGAVGKTYEQASTRGLVVKRNDDTTLLYRDAIQHHFISSLATVQTAAKNRKPLLQYFYDYRKSAVAEGQNDLVKEFIFPPGKDINRVKKLIGILMHQGVEVKLARQAFSNSKVKDYYSDRLQQKHFPAGTYLVSLAQPEKHLVKTLLDRQTNMDKAFIDKQKERHKNRRPDEVYDITGWSLPLIYDVEAYRAEIPSRGQFNVLQKPPVIEGKMIGSRAKLAYVIPWGTNSAVRALSELFKQHIRVFSTDKKFTLRGRTFSEGSLIIKVKNNPDDLYERLTGIAKKTGADIVGTNTSWVEKGINFGSDHVNYLKRPKVALVYGAPTHPYSVGWTRYILEQAFSYPLHLLNARQLPRFNLKKYNVLIIPNSAGFYGNYKRILGESFPKRLKSWLEDGGTLITFGNATTWLTGEKVALLASMREYRGGKPVESGKKEKSKPHEESQKDLKKSEETFNLEKAILPDKEMPEFTPGAILRVKLDSEHWLASGYDGYANVMVDSRNIFRPMKLNKGRNIALFEKKDHLLLSGFTWDEPHKQLAEKAYLMYQRHGKGQIIAFSEDPNFRGFMDGLNILFMNAVFLAPAR